MAKMTTNIAWLDFWKWLKDSGTYKLLRPADKQQLQNTRQAVIHRTAGIMRVERAFTKYRPGVYVLNGWWTKKD